MDGRRWGRATLAAALTVAATTGAAPQPATAGGDGDTQTPADLALVLDRAALYVVDYDQRLGNVVCRERAVQVIRENRLELHQQRRTLTSDLVLILLQGIPERLAFRDVFEVDGRPVDDRQDLPSLFAELPPTAHDKWRVLAAYGARYNLGDVRRNINVPTLALVFLRPENQARFHFVKRGDKRAAGGVTTWVVSFEEVVSPTLIVDERDQDNPAHGKFWIEPETGRVFRTEMELDKGATEVRIAVDYRPDEELDLLVPKVMKESYQVRGQRTEARARYSDFQRFEVEVGVELR